MIRIPHLYLEVKLDVPDQTTVSVNRLNRAAREIRNLREDARRVRKEADLLEEAKLKAPKVFTPERIARDRADAEREAKRLERQAEEIEAAALSGMISRDPAIVRAEIAVRRASEPPPHALPLGVMPPRPVKRPREN